MQKVTISIIFIFKKRFHIIFHSLSSYSKFLSSIYINKLCIILPDNNVGIVPINPGQQVFETYLGLFHILTVAGYVYLIT